MRPLIAGNWKMHGTAPHLSEIASLGGKVIGSGLAHWAKTGLPTEELAKR
jgi:hypothetical protein